MRQDNEFLDAVLEDSGLTLNQVAALCDVEIDWLLRHIEEGLLNPMPRLRDEWRFSGANLLRVRRIVVLERDFEAVPELAALVADMQEEIETLHRRLRRAGLE